MNLLLRSLASDLRASNIRSQATPDGNTLVVKYPITMRGSTKYLDVQIMADPQINGKFIYLVYDLVDKKMPNSRTVEKKMIEFNKSSSEYKLVVDKEKYVAVFFEQYITGVSDTEVEMHCLMDILRGFTDLMEFVNLHRLVILNIVNS